MKILWDGNGGFASEPTRSYKTYANAVKAAEKLLGDLDHRVIIASTKDGRFFPVCIGTKAIQDGVHFHMCVAA